MNVTVFFLGICTHVVKRTSGGEIENVRVVLPDASFGRHIAGHQIPPHSALINIPPAFIANVDGAMLGLQPTGVPAVWSMSGVSLDVRIPGLPSGGLAVAPSYQGLPSLTAVLESNRIAFAHPLEIDRNTVDEGGAACVFTIEHGSLDALAFGEAVHGQATFTAPDGSAPQLRIVRMWDHSPTHITLRRAMFDGVEIDPYLVIANTGTNDDKEIDFLLHYGVTTFTPLVPLTFPLVQRGLIREASEHERAFLNRSPLNPADTVTHGCSNSIYP